MPQLDEAGYSGQRCPQCRKAVYTDDYGTLIDCETGGDVCGALGGNEPHKDIYAERSQTVFDKFKPDMLGLLEDIQAEANHAGIPTKHGPLDTSTDDWQVSLTLATGDRDEDIVDISVELPEQRNYEGSGDGISFGLEVHKWGGQCITTRKPWNFTDAAWVSIYDADAIEHRWEEMRDWVQRDISDIITQILTGEHEGPLPGIL